MAYSLLNSSSIIATLPQNSIKIIVPFTATYLDGFQNIKLSRCIPYGQLVKFKPENWLTAL